MKTILKSLAAIVAVGAIAGGATFAYFSDTESSDDNLLTAGTLDLVVGGQVPIVLEDMYPGQSEEKVFTVKNEGSITGHIRVAMDDIVNDDNGINEPESEAGDNDNGAGNGELCENLKVQIDQVSQNNYSNVLRPLTNGVIPFNDLPNVDWQNNIFLDEGDTDAIKVTFMVDGDTGNIIQSDKCGFDLLLTLIQDVDEDGTGDDDDADYPDTF